jgi:hypothetical protein
MLPEPSAVPAVVTKEKKIQGPVLPISRRKKEIVVS